MSMLTTLATEAATPGARNDDWAGATANGLAVVLDGLTESGPAACLHGTAWYVHQLGTRLLAIAGAEDARTNTPGGGPPLDTVLAIAIADVARSHADTCQPQAPTAPGATVAMLRLRGTTAEYLLLSDAVLVLDIDDEPVVVSDTSVRSHLPELMSKATSAAGPDGGAALSALIRQQQLLRNTPRGYWVARGEPEAARHATTGTVEGLRGALLLSDGAALLVTDFAALTWRELLDLGYAAGPHGIITATRELEDRDPDRKIWPRYKSRDDATAIVCQITSP
jgi:hypothetical protein